MSPPDATRAAYARERRRVLLAWAALLALMFTSLGSAYLPLGAGNAAAGVAIAVVKSSIVLWLFMRLRSAPAIARIAAAAGLSAWLLLVGLSSVDVVTRPNEPAPWQAPQQLQPVVDTAPSPRPSRPAGARE